MEHVHILLKPASGACDLRCRYCFYRDEMEHRRQGVCGFMSEATLERVIRAALAESERACTIAFQGGEPTLVGLDFYKKAVELEARYARPGVTVHNAIQTNGWGLDAAWADFFRDHHFLVGISLDGTADTHDHNRRDAAGQGTFARVWRTIELLQARGVEYNILTVVNRQTARQAQRIYSFYQRSGLSYLQFIPCLDPLGQPPSRQPYSLTAKAYGQFLNTLFDLWYRDVQAGKAVSILQFETYVEMLLGYPPSACGMGGVCGCQHVVEADGSVYPCDFYVLDEYCLGNLNQTDLRQINQKREEIGFVRQSRQVDPVCRRCPWYGLCRGGCRRHRPVRPDGSLGRSIFCEGYQMFFAHTIRRLKELAVLAADRGGL